MVEPVVIIKHGGLKGKVEKDYKGRNYYSFKGIPYAKLPVGSLRFKAPEHLEGWRGIRDATDHGSVCGAKDLFTNQLCGSEDCLFINVYTPKLPVESPSPKPVMCWIHGGAFICGSGNSDLFGPGYLITEDVVLVTFNYRLGILGFLCFDDPSLDVPGNAGLKDQVMALQWIQKNIANFGGDPNNVTIFGESAGSASVHLLMLSPLATGLFHKAIMQSGSALSSWAMGKRSLSTLRVALSMERTEKELLNILLQMSLKEILQLQFKISDQLVASMTRPFCPVVENTSSKMAFLLNDPLQIIQSGNYNRVPVLTGYTSREGMIVQWFNKLYCRPPVDKKPVVNNFEDEIPFIIRTKNKSELAAKIRSFYFGNEASTETNRNQYYLLQGDNCFVWPLYFQIKHMLDFHCTYFYRVTVETQLNMFKKVIGETTPGVCHADDLPYLFTNTTMDCFPLISNELKTVQRFTKLWTNFAKTGNPNPSHLNSLINMVWKPVDKNQLHYLDIGENLTVGVNPDEDRMAFWDELFVSA